MSKQEAEEIEVETLQVQEEQVEQIENQIDEAINKLIKC
jgi:hypothetical protein